MNYILKSLAFKKEKVLEKQESDFQNQISRISLCKTKESSSYMYTTYSMRYILNMKLFKNHVNLKHCLNCRSYNQCGRHKISQVIHLLTTNKFIALHMQLHLCVQIGNTSMLTREIGYLTDSK